MKLATLKVTIADALNALRNRLKRPAGTFLDVETDVERFVLGTGFFLLVMLLNSECGGPVRLTRQDIELL